MCKSEKNRKNETNAFPVWLIVGIVGVLILLAYVVHRLSPQIASLITADGMLSYIGSGISSVATIVLAIVAYRQTERANSMADKLTQQSNSFAEQANELAQQLNKVAKRANELTEKANGISERVTNLEEERFKMEIRPFVLVTDWSVYKGKPAYDGERKTMTYYVGQSESETNDIVTLILELTNTTQSFEIVQYSTATEQTGKKWGMSVVNQNKCSVCIPAGESRKVEFSANKSFFSDIEGKSVNFEFILRNRFDEPYKETFELAMLSFDWTRDYSFMHPQKYEITRF